jgi:hypothetical protein
MVLCTSRETVPFKKLLKKFPDLQFLTADRMSRVTHFSSNDWTIPLITRKTGGAGVDIAFVRVYNHAGLDQPTDQSPYL